MVNTNDDRATNMTWFRSEDFAPFLDDRPEKTDRSDDHQDDPDRVDVEPARRLHVDREGQDCADRDEEHADTDSPLCLLDWDVPGSFPRRAVATPRAASSRSAAEDACSPTGPVTRRLCEVRFGCPMPTPRVFRVTVHGRRLLVQRVRELGMPVANAPPCRGRRFEEATGLGTHQFVLDSWWRGTPQ